MLPMLMEFSIEGVEEFLDEMISSFEVVKDFLLPLGCALILTLVATILFVHFSSRHQQEGKNVWKWLGAAAIMCIPVVSIIMLFVWAYSGKTQDDPTFRGWARFNLAILLFVVVAIISTIGMLFLFSKLGI